MYSLIRFSWSGGQTVISPPLGEPVEASFNDWPIRTRSGRTVTEDAAMDKRFLAISVEALSKIDSNVAIKYSETEISTMFTARQDRPAYPKFVQRKVVAKQAESPIQVTTQAMIDLTERLRGRLSYDALSRFVSTSMKPVFADSLFDDPRTFVEDEDDYGEIKGDIGPPEGEDDFDLTAYIDDVLEDRVVVDDAVEQPPQTDYDRDFPPLK